MIVEVLKMGDSEDPYLMASFPLYDWEKTEKALWLKERAIVQATYICTPNHQLGWDIVISAELSKEHQVEFVLKYGS
jgi:hypothetical protein